jgi:hypothetical protein
MRANGPWNGGESERPFTRGDDAGWTAGGRGRAGGDAHLYCRGVYGSGFDGSMVPEPIYRPE